MSDITKCHFYRMPTDWSLTAFKQLILLLWLRENLIQTSPNLQTHITAKDFALQLLL